MTGDERDRDWGDKGDSGDRIEKREESTPSPQNDDFGEDPTFVSFDDPIPPEKK